MTLETYDEDYVPSRVKQVLIDELSVGTATFRDLDDPANVRQPRTASTNFVEVEFPGHSLNKDEYGNFGNNAWDGMGAFQIHVFIAKTKNMQVARGIMSVVANLFIGRQIDNVYFMGGLAPFVDAEGDGLFRGISRSIEYRYEFANR